MKKKILPYILFGIPLLIGGYFVIKSMRKPKGEVEPTPPNPTPNPTPNTYTQKNELPFKKGDKGGYVVAIQRVLGISQDGKFGSDTDASVRAYQKKLGLKVDGIVGANTWKALFNADFPNEKKLSSGEIDIVMGADKNPYLFGSIAPTPTIVMKK